LVKGLRTNTARNAAHDKVWAPLQGTVGFAHRGGQTNLEVHKNLEPTLITNRPKYMHDPYFPDEVSVPSSPKEKEMLNRLTKVHELHELKYKQRVKDMETQFAERTGRWPQPEVVRADEVGSHMHRRVIEREHRFSEKLREKYPQVYASNHDLRALEKKQIVNRRSRASNPAAYSRVLDNTWLKEGNKIASFIKSGESAIVAQVREHIRSIEERLHPQRISAAETARETLAEFEKIRKMSYNELVREGKKHEQNIRKS